MKKNNILFVMLFAFLFGIINVNAAKNPYKENGPYGTNCTWYVWQQVYDKAGIALPGFSNAKNWYNDAKKARFEVGSEPRPNSIVVWDNWTEYGHVGYVERVEGDKIYVWDSTGGDTEFIEPQFSECILASPSIETDAPCYQNYSKTVAAKYETNGYYKITGYIYLDKAPTKPAVSNNENTSSNTETPKTETKKSNNANLSSLKIDNLDFEFKKDTLKYKLVVENNIENIKINAKTENNKAKVSGDGEHKLNVGINTIELIVTAEDNSNKTYTLEIKRKDNNANLSSLGISTLEFEFDKDTLEYELDVDNEISKINIAATTESDFAKIEGIGEYNLNEGDNIITLVVTAEDNTEKIYKLNIKREIKEASENIEEEKNLNKQKLYLIIGIGVAILLIIIVVIAVLVIKRKKKSSKSKDSKKKNSKKTKK